MYNWQTSDGNKIACTEKLKVMQQNIDELSQIAQDAFEDGVLMGIDPQQIRQYLSDLMLKLDDSFNKANKKGLKINV